MMDSRTEAIRNQYERFPYPPISRTALPARNQKLEISYENATRVAFGSPKSHHGIRILIVGCGTFEPLVVSQSHPYASETVALDISENSLSRLKDRSILLRMAHPFRKMPSLTLLREDVMTWEPSEQFDWIIASNVLHHLPEPAEGLRRLARWLTPNGILRIVTYPKQSRIWMRMTSRWLKLNGISPDTPHLKKAAHSAIQILPADHPIRNCFKSHPEIHRETGIVDAFLNAQEAPLSPLEWKVAASDAGLILFSEEQRESSSSQLFDELFPSTTLDVWEKLEIMDCTLELCANPIFWFRKGESQSVGTKKPNPISQKTPITYSGWVITSPFFSELNTASQVAEELLARAGIRIEDYLNILKERVGPRMTKSNQTLNGLSFHEYELSTIRMTSGIRIEELYLLNTGSLRAKLRPNGAFAPAHLKHFAEQVEWLALRYGTRRPRLIFQSF